MMNALFLISFTLKACAITNNDILTYRSSRLQQGEHDIPGGKPFFVTVKSKDYIERGIG